MNQSLLGISMLVVGLGLATRGVIVLIRRGEEPPALNESPRAFAGTASEAPSPEPRQPAAQTPEEKGKGFEEWVVKRFSRDYFTIKDWRGDKYIDGIYAESSTNPDLEVEFHIKDLRKPFAVECKWRQGYERGEKPYIDWASERQIENYRAFAQDRGVPVFAVIGVGGQPDSPDEVFVVNLNHLKYSKATAEYLARFRRRNKDQDFYYDYRKSDLK